MAVTKTFNIVLRAKDEASSSIGGVTKMLGGMAAGIGAVTLAARFLKDSIAIGAKFGQTMATVGGVTRATADEMENLTAIAREMGATTEFTATQSAEALRFLGMAGFTAEQSIAALPGTLDLATAGALDLGMAADIATNALTAMGLSVSELGRVNDVMVGTATRTNTTIEMMAEAFKFAAPLARAYGVNIEELSGLIGILANAGIRGSMAGTQLAMAIQMGDKAAAEMGIEGGTLLDVLERLRDTGASNAEIMEIFGIRAGRAALVLGDNIEAARELQVTLADTGGEARALANTMRDTTAGALKELASAFESLQITVSESSDSIVRDVLETSTILIRAADQIAAKEGWLAQVASLVNLLTTLSTPAGFQSFMAGIVAETESAAAAANTADKSLTGLAAAASAIFADLNPLVEQNAAVVQLAAHSMADFTAMLEDEARLEEEALARKERLAELDAQARIPGLPSIVGETIKRAQAESRAAAQEAQQQWQQMTNIILGGTVDMADALIDTMLGVKRNFSEIFEDMARDFIRLFLNQVLSALAAKAAFGILSFIPGFNVAAAVGGSVAGGARMAGIPGGGTTININGPIIGEERWVKGRMIPIIERAAVMGETRIMAR